MGKAEVGTPKWVAKQMKSRGLQRLRWYCEMCEKQCRDENGFKCHASSESHRRQMEIFAQNPGKFLSTFSGQFEKGFMDILSRRYRTKQVLANNVYNEYIADKMHVHMNATRWSTLSGFVQYLGKTGKCTVEENERGLYVKYIERDPEALQQQKLLERKERAGLDEDQRMERMIQKQVQAVAQKGGASREDPGKEKGDSPAESSHGGQVLGFSLVERPSANQQHQSVVLFEEGEEEKGDEKETTVGQKKSGNPSNLQQLKEQLVSSRKRKLEETIAVEEKKDKDTDKHGKVAPITITTGTTGWLRPGIVVKVLARSLEVEGISLYKKKGIVTSVLEDGCVCDLTIDDPAVVIRLDMEDCESVIPQVGGTVVILKGPLQGRVGVVTAIEVDHYQVRVQVNDDGRSIALEYDAVSRQA